MIESLPPPYLSSKEVSLSPYDPSDPSLYTPQLPTFECPRRYSSRLRRLLQQRSSSRGVYLTLHIPHTLNNCKLISIESASTSSSASSYSSSSSSSSNSDSDAASINTADTELDNDGIAESLIHYTSTLEKQPLLNSPSTDRIPFIEDLESGTLTLKPPRSSLKSSTKITTKSKRVKRVKFKKDPKYRHRDRLAYGYLGNEAYGEEKETSWLTFFLLLLLAFTMVCGAGVFIAWALGFAGGKAAATAVATGGLHSGIIAAAAAGPGAAKLVPPAGEVPGVAVQDVDTIPAIKDVEKRSSRVWKHAKREVRPEPGFFKGGRFRRSEGREEYVQSADMVF